VTEDRFNTYKEEYCWQYEIRLKNLDADLKEAGLGIEEIAGLSCSDFLLQNEEKEKVYGEAKAFIEKNEWLGKMSLHPTNFFTARYKGVLAGVVVMDMPNAFSKLLGDIEVKNLSDHTIRALRKDGVELGDTIETRKVERLISRGACVSWSPKNLASKLIAFSIKWMVGHTRFRLFTAYADTEARELGTIYQACNFYYLGKSSGSQFQYKTEKGNWTSDRYFRSRSVYKRLAKREGIEWEKEWQQGENILFDKIPGWVAVLLKEASKEYMHSCERREIGRKHKYAYVLGTSVKETKYLRRLLETRNKTYPYPKERGK
jgi:hypothetical protein